MITTVKTILTNCLHLAKDKKAWLALVAGLLLTLSYAPFEVWPLTFACLALAIYTTHTTEPELQYGKSE